MKRWKAAACAVLAGLMLAGCAVQPRTDDKQGGGTDEVCGQRGGVPCVSDRAAV